MAKPKKETKIINTRINASTHDRLSPLLVRWGYKYPRKGVSEPFWTSFIEALELGIIADDGENIVFKIPYRKD